jgi:hypothetical protein
MLKKIGLILFLALIFPVTAFAAADLRIEGSDIRFSKSPLVAGDEVRIYAKIFNNGSEDISGYATFFQGNAVIADSQVISVISGGSPEEVYVDFIVPSSSFNLRAEIRGTDPVDEDTSNNTAITSMFTPVLDDDRDGVENGTDNCINVQNANQLDSDGDGKGNACDSDDDNDGLSDEVETELGSSPTNVDSDGDGVNDPDDAYPIDPSKTKIVVEKKPEPKPVVKEAEVKKAIAKIVEDIKIEEVKIDEKVEEVAAVEVQVSELNFSPNAIFSYTRDDWDTFTFSVQSPKNESLTYEWGFGDGVKSSKSEVTHTFRKSGAYTVTLRTTGVDEVSTKESTVILIPFFSLSNNIVVLAVIMLVLLLIIGLSSLFAISRKEKNQRMYEEIESEDFEEELEMEEVVLKKKVAPSTSSGRSKKKPAKKGPKKIRVKESE